MRSTRAPHAPRLLAAATCVALMLGLTACSNSSEGGSWCGDARELDAATAEEGALNDPAARAAFTEDLQALADDAPEEIADEMNAYAEASAARFAAIDADTTPDPAVTDTLIRSGAAVNLYLEENCDGFQFGGGGSEDE